MNIRENHITACIKEYYKRRIIMPFIFITLLIVITVFSPVISLYSPKSYGADANLVENYENNQLYGKYTLENLYFTGYTKQWGSVVGYYYYTLISDQVTIVLLSPRTCEQGNPIIENVTVKCRIMKDSEASKLLLLNLSSDLKWEVEGISSTVLPYTLSEPDATGSTTIFFTAIYIFGLIYSLVNLFLCALFILFPSLSPFILRLSVYGNRRKLLAQAEEELSTLPQLATEDMFITEHFFILASPLGVAIMPIANILWIYKYSTLHKILWHHFSISYTLHIAGSNRVHIHCPKNTKSDIDGIMDYLLEANHNILSGFTEENRIIVETKNNQKITAFIHRLADIWSKIWTILNKRV